MIDGPRQQYRMTVRRRRRRRLLLQQRCITEPHLPLITV